MKTFLLALAIAFAIPASGQEPGSVGRRPYELEWAHRTRDDHRPLVDFEELTGWHTTCENAQARLARTREQQIWDRFVAKVTYRGTGRFPVVRIKPPRPIRIAQPFDAVSLWIYGNNWGWAPDLKTPPVAIQAFFADAKGKEFRVNLGQVDWKEWSLLYRRLEPEQIASVHDGASFLGVGITNGRNTEDRVLYLDNLAVFTEQFKPLTFEPRPRRGIPTPPGHIAGTNTGPGTLPFPTREQTILPDNLTHDFRTSVRADGKGFLFSYDGRDGTLVYRLEPRSGTWSDLTARWIAPPGAAMSAAQSGEIHPCAEGGVWLATGQGVQPPTKAEHLGSRIEGETVESRWRLSVEQTAAVVTFVYRIWNKSLVIDTCSAGGQIAEVRFGRALGLSSPRLVTNPFYPAHGGRPAVAVSGTATAPMFLTGNADWSLTNCSVLWAANAVHEDGVTYNGGARYVPRTDGKRNACFERFFLTLSPRYEEVLPTIPNPVSPWKQVTGTHLWRTHPASIREQDGRFWSDCHRWGMTQVVVTDHETGWRDEGESFTFRTRTAPGKGGDAGQYEYARLLQDKLGFVYGPYNNYTDFAPVNEFWTTDLISRTPENQLQHAWMRCYAPKPARAVEYSARLAPQIQAKFHFSTAYCDVHTAVAPWDRVDYDARVPGAGTMSAVFYAFGEIMLLQKQAWNGPVYSEGNHHAFYCGLTDGNYGQDQAYRPAENPWLVDFDLRKMHDLCCNFGMGSPDMFYAGKSPRRDTPEEQEAWLDRFLAATVAFGHPGFLVFEGGTRNALRSYYMLQQLHSRYCLASALEVRYADAGGRLLDTSAAVASGAFARSQVVTRYSDGTITVVNGHATEQMRVRVYDRDLDLPPNGYCGWTADGLIDVKSQEFGGHRADYAATPAYLYIDGRHHFVRTARAAGNGIGICRILHEGYEILLHDGADCGFAISAGSARALAADSRDLGPTQVRKARGLTYVVPVKGAFSYLLTQNQKSPHDPATSHLVELQCDRETVRPGETVTVRGKDVHSLVIPAQSRDGERLWFEFEGGWIDFTARKDG